MPHPLLCVRGWLHGDSLNRSRAGNQRQAKWKSVNMYVPIREMLKYRRVTFERVFSSVYIYFYAQ